VSFTNTLCKYISNFELTGDIWPIALQYFIAILCSIAIAIVRLQGAARRIGACHDAWERSFLPASGKSG
jgi:hypothetical protein